MKKFIKKVIITGKIKLVLIYIFHFIYYFSYRKLSVLATYNSEGVHEKQRFLKYHDFFINNLGKSNVILDVGCSYGDLTMNLCQALKDKEIHAIEIEREKFVIAKEKLIGVNVILGDIMDYKIDNIDTVVMSNVYEHIDDRHKLLSKFRSANIATILVRVPAYDRDWLIPFFDYYDLDYRLDETHFIEFTKNILLEEFESNGYCCSFLEMKWGEYYAVFKAK